jgi:hypothetical protein
VVIVLQFSLVRIQRVLVSSGMVGLALTLALPVSENRRAEAQLLPGAALAATNGLESTEETDSQAPEDLPLVDLNPYIYNDIFSVGLPAGWQITEQGNLPQVVATNINEAATIVSPTPIRTEISWFDAPPETIVPEALQTIQRNGYTVSRYDSSMVDGTTAVQIWLIDLPEDLPNAYISYIGYDEATVTITSYYQEPLPVVDALLAQIHGSFQQVSPSSSNPQTPAE